MRLLETLKRLSEKEVKKESGNYYTYKVAYALRHLVVDVMVVYFYFESDCMEVPLHIQEEVEKRRMTLMSKCHCNVTIEATKLLEVDKKEYKKYKRGRVSKYNPRKF